jgi:hypothetical protein
VETQVSTVDWPVVIVAGEADMETVTVGRDQVTDVLEPTDDVPGAEQWIA